ncbi:MAG: hypothetical protein H6934_01425 [Burkholderiaceae bacterium]|nr:hypothetical protein [Burkholderiaceae bacterium]
MPARRLSLGRVAGYALLLAVLLWAISSGVKAARTVREFPVHGRYAAPSGPFIAYSIGSLANLSGYPLDAQGILTFDYGGKLGRQYNPLFIADFAMSLAPFASDGRARQLLFANLEFLRGRARPTAGGNLAFPYEFDFTKLGESAPWYSAMAQARIGEAMMWGYRLSGEARWLDAAKRAVFALEDGMPGKTMARRLEHGIWLKEFPGYRFNVLDGMLVAIVGVHQVYRGLPQSDPDRPRMWALIEQSLEGFKRNHACFVAPTGGVYFSDNRVGPNQGYYDLIMKQLAYLAKVDPEIDAIAARYSMAGMGLGRKLALNYWYVLTRRMSRFGLIEPCVR